MGDIYIYLSIHDYPIQEEQRAERSRWGVFLHQDSSKGSVLRVKRFRPFSNMIGNVS